MNKRLIIFGVLLAALLLSAASPFPAVLEIWNYTGDNIYITLRYRGEQKYFLTATVQGNTDDYNISRFDIVRRTYSARITACDTTTSSGRLRMASNVRLVFPDCTAQKQVFSPKFWGEPTQEKVTFFVDPAGREYSPPDGPWWGGLNYKDRARTKQAFRFLYDLP